MKFWCLGKRTIARFYSHLIFTVLISFSFVPFAFSETEAKKTYIIQFKDAATPSYKGDIALFKATRARTLGFKKFRPKSAESLNYSKFLKDKQSQFLSRMSKKWRKGLRARHHFKHAINGVAIELTDKEAVGFANDPDVKSIHEEFMHYPMSDSGPTWLGAPGIWDGSITGVATKGEGVVVGVLDTGINPDHPSFAETGGDGYQHSNPKGKYFGVCDSTSSVYDSSFPCNNKLIGAWSWVNNNNPIDADGHGSHTASTAAGNVVNGATVNTDSGKAITANISGVAPHANIISYAICDNGCPGSAILAAIEQAIEDGVDVINYSVGNSNPSQGPWSDSGSQAWLNVREAGIFVATSAGNSGNDLGTVGSPAYSPWMMAVGASSHNTVYMNKLISMTGGNTTPPADLVGRSVTVGLELSPIVYAGDYGDALCKNASGNNYSGKIVVCDRGEIARKLKGSNVQAQGAIGMVLVEVNASGGVGGMMTDTHVLPAVHLKTADGIALKNWLASGSNHMAAISGTTVEKDDSYGDLMAQFSSRGVSSFTPSIIKPDVTATGYPIFAAYHDGPEYDIIQGTSMSSPSAAGAGALLVGLYPDWTPAEIQSALMMTGYTNVLDDDGVSQATPFARGAGRVDLENAAMVGFVMNETVANFNAANPSNGGDPKTLNIPSLANDACMDSCSWTRTVRSVSSQATNWTVTTTGDPGVNITVSPGSFSLAVGGTQTLTITAEVSGAPQNTWSFGEVLFQEDNSRAANAHFPVAAYASPLQYCSAQGNTSSYEWIENVTIGSFSHDSGNSGYTDFTGTTINFVRGTTKNLTLTPGFSGQSYTEYWKIFVDLNKNGTFTDTGEEVYASSGSNSAVSGTMSIPSTTDLGNTRMRVIMRYNGAPSACGNFSYGEVEDYTISIEDNNASSGN